MASRSKIPGYSSELGSNMAEQLENTVSTYIHLHESDITLQKQLGAIAIYVDG